MVCDKCEKKLGTVITPDTWKDGARNTTESGGRKLNENKALTSKKARFDPYGKNKFAICRICKSSVHQPGSHYCQGCAYKKGQNEEHWAYSYPLCCCLPAMQLLKRMCRFQMASLLHLLVLASLLSSAHLSAVPQIVQIFQLCSTQRCFGRYPLPVFPQSWARMAGAFVLSVVIKAICKSWNTAVQSGAVNCVALFS
uniref:cysteine-rich PDZ-binding protein isoform X1 n=1 Tax=Agelaius phoeniceus TaxID=39638 RepID=UPI0023ECF04B|nr:cysteine-rich PDZ-binding protein isoform X1 [Agelaius phoeniceus]